MSCYKHCQVCKKLTGFTTPTTASADNAVRLATTLPPLF